MVRYVRLCLLLLIVALAAPCEAIPPVERAVLPNGLVLLTCREPSLPVVTINLLIKGGSADDPRGKEGLAQLTMSMLSLGTAKRSALQISGDLDFMGADLSGQATKDYTTFSLRLLKRELNEGFALFMELVQEATFPADEMERERTKQMAAIQAEDDQPGHLAMRVFGQHLYGDGPYGHQTIGTKATVSQLSRDDVLWFYREYYKPNNAIIVIVGDLDKDSLERMTARLRGWARGTAPVGRRQEVPVKMSERVTVDRPVTQANIIIGHRGISRDNPDYYAVSVMNYILGGGGFSSRLMGEIRNERGLAYSVDSVFNGRKASGEFEIVLQTKNASSREAIDLALSGMRGMQQKLVSERELEEARKYLVGSFPLRFNTQAKIAGFLSLVEYFGLGLDYAERYPSLIRSVSREDVLRVARQYLHPDDAIVVIVADLKEAGMADQSDRGGKP